jgi:hypothetical protein
MFEISKLFKFSVIVAVLCVFSSWVHPFYVGISHVRINTKQSEAQIEVRLFTDDFQQAVKSEGLYFNPKKRDSLTINSLQVLMGKYVTLWGKDKDQQWIKVPLKLIGFEEESEATWFYLESAQLPQKISRWKFQNTWLFKEHPEQMHVVHAEIGSEYRRSEQLQGKKINFEF